MLLPSTSPSQLCGILLQKIISTPFHQPACPAQFTPVHLLNKNQQALADEALTPKVKTFLKDIFKFFPQAFFTFNGSGVKRVWGDYQLPPKDTDICIFTSITFTAKGPLFPCWEFNNAETLSQFEAYCEKLGFKPYDHKIPNASYRYYKKANTAHWAIYAFFLDGGLPIEIKIFNRNNPGNITAFSNDSEHIELNKEGNATGKVLVSPYTPVDLDFLKSHTLIDCLHPLMFLSDNICVDEDKFWRMLLAQILGDNSLLNPIQERLIFLAYLQAVKPNQSQSLTQKIASFITEKLKAQFLNDQEAIHKGLNLYINIFEKYRSDVSKITPTFETNTLSFVLHHHFSKFNYSSNSTNSITQLDYINEAFCQLDHLHRLSDSGSTHLTLLVSVAQHLLLLLSDNFDKPLDFLQEASKLRDPNTPVSREELMGLCAAIKEKAKTFPDILPQDLALLENFVSSPEKPTQESKPMTRSQRKHQTQKARKTAEKDTKALTSSSLEKNNEEPKEDNVSEILDTSPPPLPEQNSETLPEAAPILSKKAQKKALLAQLETEEYYGSRETLSDEQRQAIVSVLKDQFLPFTTRQLAWSIVLLDISPNELNPGMLRTIFADTSSENFCLIALAALFNRPIKFTPQQYQGISNYLYASLERLALTDENLRFIYRCVEKILESGPSTKPDTLYLTQLKILPINTIDWSAHDSEELSAFLSPIQSPEKMWEAILWVHTALKNHEEQKDSFIKHLANHIDRLSFAHFKTNTPEKCTFIEQLYPYIVFKLVENPMILGQQWDNIHQFYGILKSMPALSHEHFYHPFSGRLLEFFQAHLVPDTSQQNLEGLKKIVAFIKKELPTWMKTTQLFIDVLNSALTLLDPVQVNTTDQLSPKTSLAISLQLDILTTIYSRVAMPHVIEPHNFTADENENIFGNIGTILHKMMYNVLPILGDLPNKDSLYNASKNTINHLFTAFHYFHTHVHLYNLQQVIAFRYPRPTQLTLKNLCVKKLLYSVEEAELFDLRNNSTLYGIEKLLCAWQATYFELKEEEKMSLSLELFMVNSSLALTKTLFHDNIPFVKLNHPYTAEIPRPPKGQTLNFLQYPISGGCKDGHSFTITLPDELSVNQSLPARGILYNPDKQKVSECLVMVKQDVETPTFSVLKKLQASILELHLTTPKKYKQSLVQHTLLR